MMSRFQAYHKIVFNKLILIVVVVSVTKNLQNGILYKNRALQKEHFYAFMQNFALCTNQSNIKTSLNIYNRNFEQIFPQLKIENFEKCDSNGKKTVQMSAFKRLLKFVSMTDRYDLKNESLISNIIQKAADQKYHCENQSDMYVNKYDIQQALRAYSLFKAMDLNKQNQVLNDDLKIMLQVSKGSLEIDNEQFNQIIQKLDSDGKGYFDLECWMIYRVLNFSGIAIFEDILDNSFKEYHTSKGLQLEKFIDIIIEAFDEFEQFCHKKKLMEINFEQKSREFIRDFRKEANKITTDLNYEMLRQLFDSMFYENRQFLEKFNQMAKLD